jgi:hypothetical protein
LTEIPEVARQVRVGHIVLVGVVDDVLFWEQVARSLLTHCCRIVPFAPSEREAERGG